MTANRLFKSTMILMASALVLSTQNIFAAKKAQEGQIKASQRFVHNYGGTGNPYLPLWEHVPDGEPKVFEDPDRPGHYRAYIIGSHDVSANRYCGPDIRIWSAPVENLNEWRDDGPVFTYQAANGRWDVMYAPDLVEVIEKDEKGKDKKVYYLYPHSRGPRREAMVCKGDRPDGPFTPLNLDENGAAIQGSCIGFDPSVFIEKVTDSSDPDYAKGFRAYAFWGFQHSTGAQLDQNTMYSVRPGTSPVDPLLPASSSYGRVRGAQDAASYPALAEGQNPGEFNFFEASSIRQVGNKYVMIFSGYSGPDYGLGSTNSALRYCYGDSPLGPWKSGGVAVDSRGPILSEDGSKLITSNFAHNTHGSIEKIGDQWYIFYHRPPRGNGNARQAMVAPVKITWDEKPVSEGGKVVITGYDPYADDETWTAKASNGDHYTGAEVTSEGFNIFGLPPYKYYSAGYACVFINKDGQQTNRNSLQDTWDVWNNEQICNVEAGDIIGYKYFGLGGLAKDTKGIEAFDGTTSKKHSSFNIWFERTSSEGGINVKVMMDGPWKNGVYDGIEIGKFKIPANSPVGVVQKYTIDVSEFVDDVDGKHAIYLVFDAAVDGPIGKFYGCGFNPQVQALKRPNPPVLNVTIGGKAVELPAEPVHSNDDNGYTDNTHYEMDYQLEPGQKSKVKVECVWSTMQFWVEQIKGNEGTAVITAEYLFPGTNSTQTKVYKINIKK